ncbi:hypothetical protein NTCA1_13960 [Novosphingobium sp. TCA1]|nr:hypothetical protein NTCA1_13960 [Novosphingobium sp. TCA1]
MGATMAHGIAARAIRKDAGGDLKQIAFDIGDRIALPPHMHAHQHVLHQIVNIAGRRALRDIAAQGGDMNR